MSEDLVQILHPYLINPFSFVHLLYIVTKDITHWPTASMLADLGH